MEGYSNKPMPEPKIEKKKVLATPTEGDQSWERTGQRMRTEEVSRLNELRQASKVRALSSSEEQEIVGLEQRNKTRTRFE